MSLNFFNHKVLQVLHVVNGTVMIWRPDACIKSYVGYKRLLLNEITYKFFLAICDQLNGDIKNCFSNYQTLLTHHSPRSKSVKKCHLPHRNIPANDIMQMQTKIIKL